MNNSYRYSRLNEEDGLSLPESSSNVAQVLQRQEKILQDQDEDLELVGNSVRTLKGMSHRIGEELDTQSVLLDDLGHDMDRVQNTLDGVMKKMAKLSHLDDDGRQCKMIIILSVLLFFLVFLLIVL
ncbi:unnamed protein product [Caenorhabditis auriculariae]|uniref:t-SNARE coiled-coil homology domain-containing protein n=1 Tax=Caenorhabditis auriculariae TaxID=2777116 RepID=A0A8S1GXY7_9PELO|nr:unnamed protein product [Caenorhabditis auriculariae]